MKNTIHLCSSPLINLLPVVEYRIKPVLTIWSVYEELRQQKLEQGNLVTTQCIVPAPDQVKIFNMTNHFTSVKPYSKHSKNK